MPMCMLSHFQLFKIPWTLACQVPLSMQFSWQEYWSGLPFPPPGNLPDTGLNSCLLWLLHKRWILYHWATRKPLDSNMLLLLSCFSRVRLCATPQTAAHQAPLPSGFSRQEHWSRFIVIWHPAKWFIYIFSFMIIYDYCIHIIVNKTGFREV